MKRNFFFYQTMIYMMYVITWRDRISLLKGRSRVVFVGTLLKAKDSKRSYTYSKKKKDKYIFSG